MPQLKVVDERFSHTKKCECVPCVKRRVADYIERVYDTSKLVPMEGDQTIAVRAHWRRSGNHLSKMPKTRALLAEQLAAMRRKAGL